MRRAQMINSQIFIYVLALVVTSLILLYGYNAISKMRKQTDTVSLLQFRTELTNTVESLGYEYGSVEIKSIAVPTGTREVCFVWLVPDGGNPSFPAGTHGLIQDSVDSGSDNNVFILGSGVMEPLSVGKISVGNSDNFYCAPAISGKISIRLEAMGRTVQVSEP